MNTTTTSVCPQGKLRKFENLVDVEFSRANSFFVNDLLIQDFRENVHAETDQVKEGLMETMLMMTSDYEKTKFIRYHQRLILLLIGNLVRYTTPNDLFQTYRTADRQTLMRYAYDSLQDMIIFMEQNYFGYLNGIACIPVNYLVFLREKMKNDAAILTETLATKEIDNDLVRFMVEPFRAFQSGDDPQYACYSRIKWLIGLRRQFVPAAASKVPENEEEVFEVLIGLNFNDPQFVSYCKKRITRLVEESDPSVCIKKLAYLLKVVRQSSSLTVFSFVPHSPSLRDQLTGLIQAEIEYHKIRITTANTSEPAPERTPFKVNINMSVGLLAYLIRIMVEARIIQNIHKKNMKRLLTLVARCFTTDHTEDISAESLRNRYNKPRGRVREDAKDVLLRLLNHIHLSRA